MIVSVINTAMKCRLKLYTVCIGLFALHLQEYHTIEAQIQTDILHNLYDITKALDNYNYVVMYSSLVDHWIFVLVTMKLLWLFDY